jgi:oxalate decarboxylase
MLWADITPIDMKASVSRVNQFMQKGKDLISPDFPYRLNLPANGQIAKNNAGIRIAETAQQLREDNAGLLFFYKLYDHSMRVPHWHANATEVGVVLKGKMRVIIWEGKGKLQVFTIEKDGTWTIPPATLHALENVGGKDELTFLVSYNAPNAADRDFATAWAALPDEILERSLGLTAEDIANVRKSTVNRLSLYDPSASPEQADVASPYASNFQNVQPLLNSELGSVRRIDASNTPMMQAMALQQTILKPGTMREPHWYVGTNTFLYVYKGSAFFTMMDDSGKVYNAIVKPGDVIYIPVGVFHSYVNIENNDLEVYESFTSSKDISEITLLNGAQHLPARTLSGAVGITKESAERIINKKSQSYIIPF